MDYTATTKTVVFGPEESSKNVSVAIKDDDVLEESEVFFATLTTSDPKVDFFGFIASVSIIDNEGEFWYRKTFCLLCISLYWYLHL